MTVPFVFHRKVAFGECDPARILFTPRAIGYSLEATEAWFDRVLGVTWGDLICRHGLEVRFITTECEYKQSLVAGQVVYLVVAIIATGEKTFLLSVAGELESGGLCFQARLEIGFVDCKSGEFSSIPKRVRELLRGYWEQCCIDVLVTDYENADLLTYAPAKTDERQLPAKSSNDVPFMRKRQVRYGECGISGYIYPPNLVECAVEMVGEWYDSYLGTPWLKQCISNIGFPFVSVRCKYLRPVKLGQIITIVVKVPRLGNASITYEIMGYDKNGVPCFDFQMVACYTAKEDRGFIRSISFPDDLRSKILAYQNACKGSH